MAAYSGYAMLGLPVLLVACAILVTGQNPCGIYTPEYDGPCVRSCSNGTVYIPATYSWHVNVVPCTLYTMHVYTYAPGSTCVTVSSFETGCLMPPRP